MVAVCLNGGMHGSNKVVSFVIFSFENKKAAILLINVWFLSTQLVYREICVSIRALKMHSNKISCAEVSLASVCTVHRPKQIQKNFHL